MKRMLLSSCTVILIVSTIALSRLSGHSRTIPTKPQVPAPASSQFHHWTNHLVKGADGRESTRLELSEAWGMCGYVEELGKAPSVTFVLFLLDRQRDAEQAPSISSGVVFVNSFGTQYEAKRTAEQLCADHQAH